MIRVSVDFLLDEHQYADVGPSPERFAANVIADLLESANIAQDVDNYRIVAADRPGADWLALWPTALVTIDGRPYPGPGIEEAADATSAGARD